MPPGGDEGQNALFPQQLQGAQGRSGDRVGLVGQKGPVDVKEYGSDHGRSSLVIFENGYGKSAAALLDKLELA